MAQAFFQVKIEKNSKANLNKYGPVEAKVKEINKLKILQNVVFLLSWN